MFAEIGEDGFKGFFDDGLGEFPRRVVGAGLAAGVGGLEENGARLGEVRGGVDGDEVGIGRAAL